MKFGVVGHGSIGSRHAQNLRTLGQEVLVFDPKGPRDVKFEKQIYEQCGAVVIATPSPYHEGPIRACVEQGCHMLIEKPISTSVGMLQKLLDDAAAKKLVVMMGNNLRFHPCVIQAKEWIEAGEIASPIWAHFICAQETTKPLYLSDGVILNTGSHEVEMALHLLGLATVIYADAGNIGDIADFMLLHHNGCRSTFHLDFITPNPIREAWIVGTKDKIGLELRNRNASLGSRAQGFGGSFDDDYLLEMKAFIDRIEGKETAGASGSDGLETLRVLLGVRRKAGLM